MGVHDRVLLKYNEGGLFYLSLLLSFNLLSSSLSLRYPGASKDACDLGRPPTVVLPINWDTTIRFTDRFLHHPGVLSDEQWAIHSALHAPPRPTPEGNCL